MFDFAATKSFDDNHIAIAAVNKHMAEQQSVSLDFEFENAEVTVYTVNGESVNSYNDVGRNDVTVTERRLGGFKRGMTIDLAPHSINVIGILQD